MHLHRFRADVHRRGRRLSLSPDGEGGRFRPDRLVCALAHPGQHDGAFPARASVVAWPWAIPPTRNPLVLFQRGFERRFEAARAFYRRVLITALSGRFVFIAGFLLASLASFALAPYLGRNFFPPVESTQIALHVRAPTGMRIEETGVQVEKIEAAIRAIIPPESLRSIVDNIGLSISGINMAYSNTGSIGASDADILITLHDGRRGRSAALHQGDARTAAAPVSGHVFRLPAGRHRDPDSQLRSARPDRRADHRLEDRSQPRLRRQASRADRPVPGIADSRIQQAFNTPTFDVDVDRTRAQIVGVSERDVAQNLQDALAGSIQSAPTFWLNPKNGVSYPIVAQTPQYWVRSLSNLRTFPLPKGRRTSRFSGRRHDQAQRQRRGRVALRGSTCYRHFRDQ